MGCYLYQFSSVAQSYPTDCAQQRPASLSIINSQSLLKLRFKSVMPSNHLILCYPLFLLPSIFPSIRVFFSEPILCIRWPKYWNFSFSISPSMNIQDWFTLVLTGLILQSKGVFKSLLTLQFKRISSLALSFFFMVQLSHPYMTTGKTITLTVWTFVGKIMSLLFSILSRFVIAFLPRRKHLLISWLQSPSAVI